MTTIGQSVLPHWMLSSDTVAGARNSTALTPKFDGFQRCRPLSAQHVLRRDRDQAAEEYGQRNGERTRMPTLMPVMYALAGCGQRP